MVQLHTVFDKFDVCALEQQFFNNAFNAITSDVAIFTDIKSFSYHMLNDSQKPNATYAIRQQQKITK